MQLFQKNYFFGVYNFLSSSYLFGYDKSILYIINKIKNGEFPVFGLKNLSYNI